MGKIVYKPHCGKCGAIIEQEVAYIKVAELRRIGSVVIDIEPSRCPRCREVFGTIEIPIPEERNDLLQKMLEDYPWVKEKVRNKEWT